MKKLLRSYICAVAGLGAAAAIGRFNAPTIGAVAALVINAGMSLSGTELCRYIRKRLFIQILAAIFGAGSLLLLQSFTPFSNWISVILASGFALAIILAVDYVLHYSTLFITAAVIGTLIMVTATAADPVYPVWRILQVTLGCLLGYGASYLLFPVTEKSVTRQLLSNTRWLLDAADQAAQERTACGAGLEGLADIKTDCTLLCSDIKKLRRCPDRRRAWLTGQSLCGCALADVLLALQACGAAFQRLDPALTDAFYETWQGALALHHALLDGTPELVYVPSLLVQLPLEHSGGLAVFLALSRYWETLSAGQGTPQSVGSGAGTHTAERIK